MKDIPMFTTEYGIASLSLQQIPYRAEAYVTVRQATDLMRLITECRSFCRMCGAERVYVTGHPELEALPLYTHVFRMTGRTHPGQTACLWPVTAENAGAWRQIYNEKMRNVDNAMALTAADERNLYQQSGAYFVHDGGRLLGIGWLREQELLALATVIPGMGETVARTLLQLAEEEPVTLEVASTNARAIRLYEKLGFIKTEILRSWYCVD